MGDNAVRWALQQTQFGPVAQLILIRLSKHVDDRRSIWSWRKKLAKIIEECNTSPDTLNRHFYELEGKDKEGNPTGVQPVLFRGFNKGRPTEYILLGPNKTATEVYIAEVYVPAKSPQDAATHPPQVAATLPPASCGDPNYHPPQVAAAPPQVAATHQDSNSFSSSSPVHDSNPKQGAALHKIWKSALTKIRTQVDSQTCFTWYDPARPVSLRDGVLTIAVPSAFFVDTLKALELKEHTILRSVLAAGLVVREITFVARPKMAAVAARASPR